jgi:hypothetical protein
VFERDDVVDSYVEKVLFWDVNGEETRRGMH